MAYLRPLFLCGRLSVLSSALLCSAVSLAQTAAPAARIVSPIDENQLVTLPGNVNPHATAKNDRGAVSPDLPMKDLVLVLGRSPEQQAAFDAFVASQYDAASPNYHQWLSPAQIGEQFGPAQADIAIISGWLTSHGFAVGTISPDRMSIPFSGAAGQVESAFHTQIHKFMANGVAHIGNVTDPQIPAALAPVLLGVKQLHDFHPHALHQMGATVQLDPQTGKWQRVASTAGTGSAATPLAKSATSVGPHPEFGINVPASPTTGSPAYLVEDLTPYDFATIYNVLPLWNSSINGAGQTIAIVGASDIDLTDVATYRKAFGLPAGPPPEEVKGVNGIDPGICTQPAAGYACTMGVAGACDQVNLGGCTVADLEESSLGVELAGAVAPGAQIVLVTSGYNSFPNPTNDPIYQSAQYVVSNHGNSATPTVKNVSILSASYALCELDEGTSGNVAYYDLWQSAAAEGISVFVSAGDAGSAGCDEGGPGQTYFPYTAQYGLAVSGIASTPYDTAVGGTEFTWCKPVLNASGALTGCPTTSSAASPYWTATNDTSTGASATGYIPENVWNDSCQNPVWAAYLESIASITRLGSPSTPEEACNFAGQKGLTISETLAAFVETVGGGGGASNCVVSYIPIVQPVSFNPYVPPCSSGVPAPNGPGSIPLTNDGWPKPSWQTGVPGIPSDGVRDLPDVSLFAGDGALQSATLICVSALGSCVTSSQITVPVPGAPAHTVGGPTLGDPARAQEVGGTSVGAPEMAGVMALINQKIGAPQGLANPELYQLAARQTYSECSAETVTNASASCYFNDVDQGTNTMPCAYNSTDGGIVSTGPGGWGVAPPNFVPTTSPNCTILNAGDMWGTLVSSGTTPAYNASTGFDLATGLGSLNVANVVNAWTSEVGSHTATITVSLSPSHTVSSTTTLSITVTVGGAAGTPTGSVVVAGGGYVTNATLNASAQATFAIPPGDLKPGSESLTITYSGDTNYASTSTTEAITVAAALPTVTVYAPATAHQAAGSFTVTVGVIGPAGSTPPTGTVTLTETGQQGTPTAVLSSAGAASFNWNSQLVGTITLTATYSGNAYYSPATGSATMIIVPPGIQPVPTVTVTPSPATVVAGQIFNLLVTVSGAAGTPTGSVAVSAPIFTPPPSAILNASGNAAIAVPAVAGYQTSPGNLLFYVTYSGDVTYAIAMGQAAVTILVPTSGISAGAPSPASVAPGGTATVTITGATTNGYTGSGAITLNSCTLTSQPANATASALPTCSVSGSITYASGVPSGSGTATVTTTAPSSGALAYPRPGNGRGWMGDGAVLAFLVFLGIPARRRSWRAMLGLAMLIAVLGSLSACGGGGGIKTAGTTSLSGTSAGAYTFTVTGSNGSAATTASATFTINVN